MNKTKILYFFKRTIQLGPRELTKRIVHKGRKKFFLLYWKQKALSDSAHHTWKQIAQKHRISSEFETFFKKLQKNDFIEEIRISSDFLEKVPRATKHKQNCFDLLGSGPICFDEQNIPWKSDFKNKHVFPDIFYQEIKPSINKNISRDNYAPDIKVPWELSRFQHLHALESPHTFQKQIESWLSQNKFLIGVNWVCPMDVAIRAINWLWGFSIFKKETSIPINFWKKIVCSLYDHAFYLENNWETSDKPNNHYIADLVGYFYLCSFFSSIPYFKKAQEKTYKKILEQFNHQIQDDGTSYEGSTAYHKLDTELFWLFALVCKTQEITLTKSFYAKLEKMFLFLEHCSINEHEMVHIGDDDSGKVVMGLRSNPSIRFSNENHSGRTEKRNYYNVADYLVSQEINKTYNPTVRPECPPTCPSKPWRSRKSSGEGGCIERYERDTITQLHHYKSFGLSIIKNNSWHITFRHPTYKSHQPTGHFHYDQLAITLAYQGIPVLIDPGSYLYTANPTWRNYFRSAQNHNTVHQKDIEKFGIDLFQLPLAPTKNKALVHENEKEITIQDSYNACTRRLTYDKKLEQILVMDMRSNPSIRFSNENHSGRTEEKNYYNVADYLVSQEKNKTYNPTVHPECPPTCPSKPWRSRKPSGEGGSIEGYERKTLSWTFLFHPEIRLQQITENHWRIEHNNKVLLSLHTTIPFILHDGFYSPSYGVLQKCCKLVSGNGTHSKISLMCSP